METIADVQLVVRSAMVSARMLRASGVKLDGEQASELDAAIQVLYDAADNLDAKLAVTITPLVKDTGAQFQLAEINRIRARAERNEAS